MRYYPLFLDLEDRRCLVAGAGSVGQRKAAGLLACPIRELYLVDPKLDELPDLPHELSQDPRLRLVGHPFLPKDLEGMSLVFAATNNKELNQEIALLCKQAGIPCNTASGSEGDFLVPAVVRSGPLQIAISTGGASPALGKFLKRELGQWLDKGYANLTILLAEIRPLLVALSLPQAENARIFNSICSKSTLEELLRRLQDQDLPGLLRLLQSELPAQLHGDLPEVLSKVITTNRTRNAQ